MRAFVRLLVSLGGAVRSAERGADNGYSQLKSKLLAEPQHAIPYSAFVSLAKQCADGEGLSSEYFNRVLATWTLLLHQEVPSCALSALGLACMGGE